MYGNNPNDPDFSILNNSVICSVRVLSSQICLPNKCTVWTQMRSISLLADLEVKSMEPSLLSVCCHQGSQPATSLGSTGSARFLRWQWRWEVGSREERPRRPWQAEAASKHLTCLTYRLEKHGVPACFSCLPGGLTPPVGGWPLLSSAQVETKITPVSLQSQRFALLDRHSIY